MAQNKVEYSLLQRAALRMVKLGSIPKHIAFIMDGNRRYAKQHNLLRSEGHLRGFSKFLEILQWCNDFTVQEVSVFAFSIENFKRSEAEVSFLMRLLEEKLQELLDKRDNLKSAGLCVRVIGNLSLLPPRIQYLSSELMLSTRHYSKTFLNIFMAYTTRDELLYACSQIQIAVEENRLCSRDIDHDLISKCLRTRRCRPVDLLLRTSGEVRVSDFLLWQCAENHAVYKFVNTFWPQLTFWDLLFATVHYQLSQSYLSRFNHQSDSTSALSPLSSTLSIELPSAMHNVPSPDQIQKTKRVQAFLDTFDRNHWQQLESICATGPKEVKDATVFPAEEFRVAQRSFGYSIST